MRRSIILFPFAALALIAPTAAVSAAPGGPPAPEKGTTVTSKQLFTFKDDRIKESSGIETSVRFRHILYTHNDSGDDARFFAVGPKGKTRAVYTLDGAGSWDWEDMAAGPNSTLWFGDIGANQLGREYISVFKVKEPTKLQDRNIGWTRYDFVYDDGQSHNAEALLVNPVTGALYVVTKAENGAGVYRASLPLSTTRDNTLNRIASAPVKVTAGDFSASGKRVVLRNYGSAFFYKRLGGQITDEIRLPSGGESIAFSRNGVGVIVGKEGLHSPVWRVVRHDG
jgi:hypothetical protein